ncbi:Na+/H+ antiporter subunit C [Ornithinimicrobium sp. CNJ-824]|uniref:sodium:proton antiporter n=1 Tax=Ornithinimicrobium sp. CNJ-824 TaxID=1904966 RepID=UPI00095C0099|nr:cation:proton antiporter subunit C [Ornithinimicrobium sp. CNJ-824]OLT21438.1 Na+/H+ antiporter subunit C [Ornithinimicrobium sp. CNJ-824]
MIIPVSIAVLVTGGVYLLLQRSMVRIIFGLALLSHAANLTLMLAGVSAWRGEPLPDRVDTAAAADPLPHAFVLTAIVIAFAVTVLMLALAVIGHNDDTKRMPPTGEERAT